MPKHESEREKCEEFGNPGEMNRIVAGDEEWGCPRCEYTWWVEKNS